MSRKFKVIRDSYGDINKLILNDYIYIEREVAKNFTRTSSRYFFVSVIRK